jgi:hypothetical protein
LQPLPLVTAIARITTTMSKPKKMANFSSVSMLSIVGVPSAAADMRAAAWKRCLKEIEAGKVVMAAQRPDFFRRDASEGFTPRPPAATGTTALKRTGALARS